MNVNVFLFDDFETLDAFGPAQIFGMAPEHFHLCYWSVNGGIVNSAQGAKIWTEELDPEEISGILLIPGGRGAKKMFYLEPEGIRLIRKAAEQADYCMMTGNGSAILAQTGLLYHREIADYSYDENWKRMFSAEIHRIPNIRWLADGKFYSASASVYSMDMALGVIEDTVDYDVSEKIAGKIGYVWNQDSREEEIRL